MNNAEKQAREIYKRNKQKVITEYTPQHLCELAMQQDKLYKVFNFRADSKIFKC